MKSLFAILSLLAFTPALHASFHLMQVEQIIGGLDGDTSAQAIQLRMRSAGQNLVSAARVRAWDAAGANPVLILNIASNVASGVSSSRILLATSSFTTAVQVTSPSFTPDFTMTNAIPPSYLAAGRLTFEQDTGTILWSLSWGGAAYTGSQTGDFTNDSDGNFGPAFGQALPTATKQGVRFTGSASASSTSNSADYALSSNPATVITNSGSSFLTGGNPEIVVEQPAGNDLVDGTASVDFGTAPTDNNTTRAFTIKNIGNSNLAGLGITIDGTDDADFTVTANPTAPVAGPSGSTNFTVRFAPATTGPKTAALHIANNDANEAPFDIALTGTATLPAGALALGGTAFVIDETAGTLNIPIVRTGGSAGIVGVTVTTTNGTAIAGADFTAPTTPQQLGDGVTTANISIPMLLTAASEPNETFTITLSAPTGGASLGTTTTATVRIIDSVDTMPPPSPLINTPGTNATVNAAISVNVTGTAADDKGVDRVEVKLNNVVVGNALLIGRGAPSATWSLGITAVPGPNTISVRSFDTHGTGSLNETTRSIIAKTMLTVNVNSTEGTVTSGFAPSSLRTVGQLLTIIATPKTGHLFLRWLVNGTPNNGQAIGHSNDALDSPQLSFICRAGITLEAQFDLNHYLDEENNGVFDGAVQASPTLPDRAPLGAGVEDGTTSDITTEGIINAAVNKNGTFTGRLTLDGLTLSISGTFDALGDARFGNSRARVLSVPRANKPSLILALKLDVINHTRLITGTVSQVSSTEITHVSTITAHQAYYSIPTHLLDTAYLGTSGAVGVFTTRFAALGLGSQPLGLTAADYPQGDGTGVVKLTKTGAIAFSGTLADGTGFTAATTLSQANTFRLFAQLYTKLGFIAGNVNLNKLAPTTDLSATNVLWTRPIQDAQHYPSGWQNVKLDALGAKYNAVTGKSVLTDLTSNGTAVLTFSAGKLTTSITDTVTISNADLVTNLNVGSTLSISRTAGAITGTFVHTDGTKPAYKAVVLQKGTARAGYGFFLTTTPTTKDYTGQSGGVLLVP